MLHLISKVISLKLKSCRSICHFSSRSRFIVQRVVLFCFENAIRVLDNLFSFDLLQKSQIFLIYVRIILRQLFKPINRIALFIIDFFEKFRNFYFFVFLKQRSVLRLEVQIDARVSSIDLIAEAGVCSGQRITEYWSTLALLVLSHNSN